MKSLSYFHILSGVNPLPIISPTGNMCVFSHESYMAIWSLLPLFCSFVPKSDESFGINLFGKAGGGGGS